jgi:hypothetical protein
MVGTVARHLAPQRRDVSRERREQGTGNRNSNAETQRTPRISITDWAHTSQAQIIDVGSYDWFYPAFSHHHPRINLIHSEREPSMMTGPLCPLRLCVSLWICGDCGSDPDLGNRTYAGRSYEADGYSRTGWRSQAGAAGLERREKGKGNKPPFPFSQEALANRSATEFMQ